MLPALQTTTRHNTTTAHLEASLERNQRTTSGSGSTSGEAQQSQKRPTSMIFRIEQLLPNVTTTMTTTPTTTTTSSPPPPPPPAPPAIKRTRVGIRPGVYMAQFTPKDTHSMGVPTVAMLSMGSPNDGISTRAAHCTLVGGQLAMSAPLLRQIKLSEDVYSFNAVFELHAGQLRVRVVRDVARDDELVAWFGEELVLLMGIPFLTPLNIQGNNRYTCHLCQLCFETPHPLKIHLALGCGRNAMEILWMRLHYALKAARSTHTTTLQLSPPPAASSTSSISPTNSPPPPHTPHVLQPPVPRFSAFRPIGGGVGIQAATPPTTTPSGLPSVNHTATLSYLPSISMAAAPLVTMSASHPMNAAAQIEAIVSNMGASKQGHLCIYCGKVYSRKYGLKIHIRTHTGFKPLKCKFCLRPFGDPSNLNKHIRLHLQTHPSSSSSTSQINPEGGGDQQGYQCHLCPKTLARRRDLQRHIETRHQMTTTTTTASQSTTTASKDTDA